MDSPAFILYLLIAVGIVYWMVLSIQATPDVIDLIEEEPTPTQLFDQEAHQ